MSIIISKKLQNARGLKTRRSIQRIPLPVCHLSLRFHGRFFRNAHTSELLLPEGGNEFASRKQTLVTVGLFVDELAKTS